MTFLPFSRLNLSPFSFQARAQLGNTAWLGLGFVIDETILVLQPAAHSSLSRVSQYGFWD